MLSGGPHFSSRNIAIAVGLTGPRFGGVGGTTTNGDITNNCPSYAVYRRGRNFTNHSGHALHAIPIALNNRP